MNATHNILSFGRFVVVIALATALFSCASKKNIDSGKPEISATSNDNYNYVKKVNAASVAAGNIVSKITFGIQAKDKDISVDGKLQMRRNQMIRITLSAPLLGFEVGRLEFTPDGVLLLDRMNKQYVRATYDDLEFLRKNQLDFYSLQALFWNQLFIPGIPELTDNALSAFSVEKEGNAKKITYSKGSFRFAWETSSQKSNITALDIEYGRNTPDASDLKWAYGSFADVEGRSYPANHTISFSNSSLGTGTIKVNVRMNKPVNDSKWDLETSISNKYKQVSAEDILGLLMKL